MYYAQDMNTPVGKVIICSDGCSIVGVWMEGQKYFASTLKEAPVYTERPELAAAEDWLRRYFNGEQPSIDELALNPQGSEFRRKVWDCLCHIPYGKTTTYGAIAKELGIRSGQAVGGAVGHNPISIIIPCHRVIGADGSLTGYAGGLDKKKALLKLEGVLPGED